MSAVIPAQPLEGAPHYVKGLVGPSQGQLAPFARSPLAGVNILIEGPTGTGKTYSIGTLVETGLEVFLLATESGYETIFGYFRDPPPDGKGLPDLPPNLHWHMVKPILSDFTSLADAANQVNKISLDAWAKMTDPRRGSFSSYVDLLRDMADFPDDRTGKKYGSVGEWGTDRVLVIDGLTGLGRYAMALVKGGKPITSQPEWGAAQEQLEALIRQLCDGCRCHFVLLAHQEREVDELRGGVQLTVSTLGRKLAPKLPPMFSDVIMASRESTSFWWNTATTGVDLKRRNLPLAEKIPPNFKLIIDKWKSRGGVVEVEA